MNVISIPPIVMSTLMFYVGFYHFLIYCRQKDNRENLTFALSCFSVGIYAVCCAGLYNVSSPEVGVEWQRFQLITLAFLAITLLWFIADYTNHTNRNIITGFTVYYVFAALAGLLIRSDLTWTSVTSIKEIQLPFGYDIIYNEMVPGILTDLQSIVGLIYFLYIFMVSLKFYRSILVTQVVLDISPWYLPRYLLPLAGMIFSSSLNSVSLAAERFKVELKRGETHAQARGTAFTSSLVPIANSLFAVGLVSLPGLMTGQILSGISPLIAVRYQIMVMCMVFGASGLSSAFFLKLLESRTHELIEKD